MRCQIVRRPDPTPPDSFPSSCTVYTRLLHSSGLVTSLKQRCREEIEQYDRCLKANTAYPATCTPQLERLWQCSENAQAGPCECGDPSHHGS